MLPLLVDAHLDLAYNALILGRDLRSPIEAIRARERELPPPLESGTCLVSIPTLLERHAAVWGSIFVAPNWELSVDEPVVYHNADEAHTQGAAQLDYYRRLADEVPSVALLQTAADLEAVLASWRAGVPQLGLFVVMEGADPIRTPDELEWWVERGLRGVGLSWSAGTRYAGGNARPGPLTADGQALLKRMAEYNLLLDLSHLWKEAAYAALDRYPGPVVASHANPRAFLDTPRALTDALIRRIAEREGVVGVIPYNLMLKSGWMLGDPRLPLSRVVEAIDYVCQCVGSAAHVGLGSDFDGGFGVASVPLGIETIADLGKIAGLLQERGYSVGEVEAIMGGNWLRVMRRVLDAF